jgi:large subunit ribosomal protein L13
MKTSTIPVSAPKWHVIDAEGQAIGRIAARAAHVLRGKHRVTFSAHQLCGDHVVVINISKMAINPSKLLQKEYFSHSGYMGHTKSVPLQRMLETHPDRVIMKAVQGMLPKNRLRAQMLKRVHVFTGSEHTHEAQKPTPLTV